MSILYEALQKARKQSEYRSEVGPKLQDNPLFTQLRSFDAGQEKALGELRQKRSRKHDKARVSFFFLVICMFVFISMVCLAALYFGGWKSLAESPGQETQNAVFSPVGLAGRVEVVSDSSVVVEPEQNLNRMGFRPEASTRREVKVVPAKTSSGILSDKFWGREQEAQPSFRCTGILGDSDERFCFLNGLIAKVGDIIDGARVVAIGTRSVSLDFEGQRLEVPLPAA